MHKAELEARQRARGEVTIDTVRDLMPGGVGSNFVRFRLRGFTGQVPLDL